MNSEHLERWQAARLRDAVRPTLGHLYRLLEWMARVGFQPSDPLYKRLDRAYDAMHARCLSSCIICRAREAGGD